MAHDRNYAKLERRHGRTFYLGEQQCAGAAVPLRHQCSRRESEVELQRYGSQMDRCPGSGAGHGGGLSGRGVARDSGRLPRCYSSGTAGGGPNSGGALRGEWTGRDRKSTRLNSSHTVISYAVFCLKKKKEKNIEEE